MSSPTSACTGSVSVLSDRQQALIQHHESIECELAQSEVKRRKLCTVVENGRVVVRPIEPPSK